MLFDNITLMEGSDFSNLTIDTGTEATRLALGSPNNGELFYQTDGLIGVYAYGSGTWDKLSSTDEALLIDGSNELAGDIIPEMSGAVGFVSARNLGSATQRFNTLYADEVFIGASSLYVNGKKVIEDNADTMTFATDPNQAMVVGTNGIGTLALTTENAILNLTSTQNEVNINGAGGIEANVGAGLSTKHINFTNASTGGNITFTSSGASSQVQFNAVSGISLTSSTITLSGTVSTDSYADLNSTISTLETNVGTHDHDAEYVNLSGDTLTGALILAADPVANNQAATKSYVDSLVTGLDTKESVRVASEINLTLTGTLTVDGILTTVGDRVLVKAQTDAKANGIYVVAGGSWSRSEDADNTPSNEVSGGMYCFVEEGTVNSDTGWTLSSPFGDAILGTDDLSFVKFSNVIAPVDSVNGYTGTITLVKADVGLSNVENTTDLSKIISTLTQTALNGKVDDAQVLTNVPVGAVFSDTTYNNATTGVAGLMSTTDKTKMDAIESGATGDQSASEILTLIKTVDGASSGLDADTLDGFNTSAFNVFSANAIPLRSSQGYIYSSYFNMSADTTSATVTKLAVETSSDGFVRWQTPTQFLINHNVLTTASTIDGGSF